MSEEVETRSSNGGGGVGNEMSDGSDHGEEVLVEEVRVGSKELEDFGQGFSLDGCAVVSRLYEELW